MLDVMLEKNGLAVLPDISLKGETLPVIIWTARDETEDVVAGFDAGADDYLRKPFALDEVYARLRTLARRAVTRSRPRLNAGNQIYDTASGRVVRGDDEIALTSRELAYLAYSMRNSSVVLTRGMIENALWNRDAEVSSNVIEVYIKRLRSKIEFEGMRPLLVTIRGSGDRFS